MRGRIPQGGTRSDSDLEKMNIEKQLFQNHSYPRFCQVLTNSAQSISQVWLKDPEDPEDEFRG